MVGVERLAFFEGLLRGEHRFRMLGREVPPVLRRPGLHQQRMALRGAGEVQRAPHLEEPAVVIDDVDLVPLGPHAALRVGHDRVVLPAIPQLLGDLDELVRPLVAPRVRRLGVKAEVPGGVVACRRDDVPARAAAADMVQRREPPGEIVRVVVTGRGGGDQANPAGGPGDRGQQRERPVSIMNRLKCIARSSLSPGPEQR